MVSNPQEVEERSSYKVFSKKQLREFQEVETWLKTISSQSSVIYLNALKRFCEWCGKNPQQLILQRDRELKNDNPNDRTGIRDLVLDFRHHLESQGYAPKTINTYDGAIRSFFTSVLGKRGIVNIRNYKDRSISQIKDLVPTLEELKKMLDAVNLEEKFRILFIAQTGMRVSDATSLKIGDIKRELELENIPLAIRFSPQKDRDLIGERIAFLGSDGVEMLKQYLKWREKHGEILTDDSPLFVGRTKKRNRGKIIPVASAAFNETIRESAKKAGIGNGNGKYGRIRTHCLRKFFITQMTNHGMEDKIVNFLTCHKISEIDCVYWNRRVDTLRRIYAERQQYVNPINGKKKHFDMKQIKGIIAKIKDLEKRLDVLPTDESVQKMILEALEKNGVGQNSSEVYESKIVNSKEEVINLSNLGYDCQSIGNREWLMRKKTLGQM
ncbi:MAG: site-specific integrase [Candidatus Thermoplasmatota archaeon]|nr:site-specific integrase [Candidatus Thermoplasmatota archaeon]